MLGRAHVTGKWHDDGELLKRGYTVFIVVHGSQPKFTIPEVLEDMHRAVRFIRFHAKEYHIDPQRFRTSAAAAASAGPPGAASEVG